MSSESQGTGTAAGNAGCPSDYGLDLYRLEGEPEDHPLRRHLESCVRCRERMSAAQGLSEEFLEQVYPETVNEVADRLAGAQVVPLRPRAVHKTAWAAAAAAIALVISGIGLWHGAGGEAGEDPSYIGAKGGLGLKISCRRADAVFRVHSDDALIPGDQLRFEVSLPRAGYLMIVSVEADGRVNLYHPASSNAAAPVEARAYLLPGSVILDQSEHAERIFALFSEAPFNYMAVRRAITAAWGAGADLESLVRLPVEAEQFSLLFRKEAGR